MRTIDIPTYLLARCCEAAAYGFSRASGLCYGLLPSLLSPDQLSTRVTRAYDPTYARDLQTNPNDIDDGTLDSWELNVLNRYKIDTGRMLVIGAGLGREALAIARRGVTVMGMDINLDAMQIAQRRAGAAGVPAWFQQATLFELPYKPHSFDYAIFASGMYSAIPGKATRQAWLRALRHPLKAHARTFLSFSQEHPPLTVGKTVRFRLNAILKNLPGANQDCQPGDTCLSGHYMHVFQTEDELRAELTEAGAAIHELNWAAGYAVLIFPA